MMYEILKLEHKHETETSTKNNEMEKTIESLRNEIEMLKTKIKQQELQMIGAVTNLAVVKHPLKLHLMERLEWGVK